MPILLCLPLAYFLNLSLLCLVHPNRAGRAGIAAPLLPLLIDDDPPMTKPTEETEIMEEQRRPIFPLRGAVFLPDDAEIERLATNNEMPERHLATVDSVLPILDVAKHDAWRLFLRRWTTDPDWLQIRTQPILHCHDQGRAAWAALEAVQWTNGTGLDVAFGPACDYVLATVSRILSFYRVPIFTNAGFSEFFIEQKSTALLTRVGPLQDHISRMLELIFLQMGWTRARMFYEKQFWATELHEAGFCKLLTNGLYARTVMKRWPLELNPAIVPTSRGADWAWQDLVEMVGVNHGAVRTVRPTPVSAFLSVVIY